MSEADHSNRSGSDSWSRAAERLGFTVGAIRFMIEREQGNQKHQRADFPELLRRAINRLLVNASKFKSGGLSAVDVLRTLSVLNIKVQGLQLSQVPADDKTVFNTPQTDDLKEIATVFFGRKGIKTVDDLPSGVWWHLRDKLTNSKKDQVCHGDGNAYCDDIFTHKEQDLIAYFAELQERGSSNAFREALGHSSFDLPSGSVTLDHLKTALSDCKEFGRPKFETGHVVGREEQIKRVQELLQERKSVVIHGFRGAGKTSLAHCVVDRIQINYGTLLWLDASSPESLQLCVASTSSSLPDNAKAQNVLLLEQLDNARNWIREKAEKEGPLLVVIDGLTDQKTFDGMPHFPPEITEGTMHLLITATHADAVPESLSALIPNSGIEKLGPLSTDDVTRALCDSCDIFQSEAENKAARKIAETVNGHPLYMTVIISFLRSEKLGFTSYLHKCFGKYDETRLLSSSHSDILNTLVSGLPLLTNLMNHLGYCDVSSVPLRLFEFSDIGFSQDQAHVDNIKERQKRVRESKVNVIILANRLEAYGLLTFTEDRQSLRVHTEIAAEFRERQKSEGQVATLELLCKILTSALEKSQTDWSFCRTLYPHAIRCVEYMQEQTLFDADLVLRCGYMKSLLGGSLEARDLLSRCLQESERTTRLQQAVAYMHLATVDRRLGSLAKALQNVEEGKAILKEILNENKEGEKKSDVEKCLSQMKEVEAEVLMDGREFKRALELLTEVRQQPRYVFSVTDASHAALLANIARAHLGQKNYTKAHESYKDAIRLIMKSQEGSQSATKPPKENSPRHKLYQAYSYVSKALGLKKKAENSLSCLEEFREEQTKCLETVSGLPSSHRYYAWGYRSVARLRRGEVEILKKAANPNREEIEAVLKKGLQAIRCCLDCHLAIASGSHQKVGKACLNVGELCVEWLQNSETDDEKRMVCQCALSYFQLGLKILKPIADVDNFKVLRTKVEAVEEDLKSPLLDLSKYAESNDADPNVTELFEKFFDLAIKIESPV